MTTTWKEATLRKATKEEKAIHTLAKWAMVIVERSAFEYGISTETIYVCNKAEARAICEEMGYRPVNF